MTRITNQLNSTKVNAIPSISGKSVGKKVKVVRCPEIALPSHLQKKKPSFSQPTASKEPESVEDVSTKEELRSFMKDIRQFNTSMEIGKNKRKIFEDKLTKLGALPPKPQKIPLPLSIALNNAKKEREKKELQKFKDSQVINHQFSQALKKDKQLKRIKSKSKTKKD